MATNSKIGWTQHTMNFWWGCNKVSEECRHCYIGPIMRRAGYEPFDGPMETVNWSYPDRRNRQAGQASERHRVFTCSMSDFFHPAADQWRPEAWEVIKRCENLDWLILTKRPELAKDRLPADWKNGYPNVWLGVTCGCVKSLCRLEHLRAIPAVVKFVSAEPLLEPMDFRPYLGWLDWIITGCERAAKEKRRQMDLDWVRDIDRQCKDRCVAHFFKQAYLDERGVPCEAPLLDGKLIQEFPALELESILSRFFRSMNT
jgi:protein gp37